MFNDKVAAILVIAVVAYGIVRMIGSPRVRESRLVGKCIAGVNWALRIFGGRGELEDITLGRYVKGNELWIRFRGKFVLPVERLRQHVMILGGFPWGADRAVSLLLEGVAKDRKAQLFFFDGDADPRTKEMFTTTMAKAKRKPLLFPDQPFNAWAGCSWRSLPARLRAVFPFGRSGGAAFYADQQAAILELACRLKDDSAPGPNELLERLDYERMEAAFSEEDLMGIEAQGVQSVRMRLRSFLSCLGTSFDGKKSFADLDSAYFSLDPFGGSTVEAQARLLLLQLTEYITHEKDPDRTCVVFLRVSPEVAVDADLAGLLEIARKLNVVVVLLLQTLADAGSLTQMARLLANTGTLIVHSDQVQREIVIGSHLAELTRTMNGGLGFRRELPLGTPPNPSRLVSREDLLQMPSNRVFVINGGEGTLVDMPSSASSGPSAS